jgi:hypothetical protein
MLINTDISGGTLITVRARMRFSRIVTVDYRACRAVCPAIEFQLP